MGPGRRGAGANPASSSAAGGTPLSRPWMAACSGRGRGASGTGTGGSPVERVRVDEPHGTGLAQVMVWPHGPVADARLARGPLLSGDGAAVAHELFFAAVDEVCERYRPLTLIVEPPAPLPLTDSEEAAGFERGTQRWCGPGWTLVVPLLDDQALLAQMHKRRRYDVRLGQRRGVVVEQVTPDATQLMTFYALLQDTARRTEYSFEPLSYYESLVRHLADETLLLFARTEGGVAAAAIVTCFGNEAAYLFAASSTKLRVTGATAYLCSTRRCAWREPVAAPGTTCGAFRTRIHPRSRETSRDRAAATGKGFTTSRRASGASASRTRRLWSGATRRSRSGRPGGETNSVRFEPPRTLLIGRRQPFSATRLVTGRLLSARPAQAPRSRPSLWAWKIPLPHVLARCNRVTPHNTTSRSGSVACVDEVWPSFINL
jgi:hypothetical protein